MPVSRVLASCGAAAQGSAGSVNASVTRRERKCNGVHKNDTSHPSGVHKSNTGGDFFTKDTHPDSVTDVHKNETPTPLAIDRLRPG